MALVVFVDVLEVRSVPKLGEPRARDADARRHVGQAMHRRVQHVHTAACNSIPGSNTASVRVAEAKEREHGQRRRQHLDGHQPRDGPGEGGAAEAVFGDAAAFVLRQRGSFLSDMSSYVSA